MADVPATDKSGAMNSTPAARPAGARLAHHLERLFAALRGLDLRRDTAERWLGGVCSGIALRLGVSPLLVRAVVILLVIAGPGAVLYLLAWSLVPDLDEEIMLDRAVSDGDALASGLLVLTAMTGVGTLPWIVGPSASWWHPGSLLSLGALGCVCFVCVRRSRRGPGPNRDAGITATNGAVASSGTLWQEAPDSATPSGPGGPGGPGMAGTASAPNAADAARRARASERADRRARRANGPNPRKKKPQWIALLILFAALALPAQLFAALGLPGALLFTMWWSVGFVAIGAVTALVLALRGHRVGALLLALTPFALLAVVFAHLSAEGYPTSGTGQTLAPRTLATSSTFSAGYGSSDLDLRGIDIASMPPTVDVRARLTAGRLRVELPKGVRVEVTGRTHVVETSVHGPALTRHEVGVTPFGSAMTPTSYGSGTKTIRLHTEVGIGQIDIMTPEKEN